MDMDADSKITKFAFLDRRSSGGIFRPLTVFYVSENVNRVSPRTESASAVSKRTSSWLKSCQLQRKLVPSSIGLQNDNRTSASFLSDESRAESSRAERM